MASSSQIRTEVSLAGEWKGLTVRDNDQGALFQNQSRIKKNEAFGNH
ncbi:hypothetical protein A2U01_0018978, partial [Trifolium medium]|nr:hypothetical protein [Trifolium medium]